MTFNREQFYGWNFYWYAIDSEGFIGKFCSGYGYIPDIIFENENSYKIVDKYFTEIDEQTDSFLSALTANRQFRGIGNYSIALAEAKKGVFIYDEKDYGPIYELHGIPKDPLHFLHTPTHIQEFLGKFRISTVKFKQMMEMDPENYLDYELGKKKSWFRFW